MYPNAAVCHMLCFIEHIAYRIDNSIGKTCRNDHMHIVRVCTYSSIILVCGCQCSVVQYTNTPIRSKRILEPSSRRCSPTHAGRNVLNCNTGSSCMQAIKGHFTIQCLCISFQLTLRCVKARRALVQQSLCTCSADEGNQSQAKK